MPTRKSNSTACWGNWSNLIARTIGERVASCLKAQGGLEQCHLAFYQEGDLGNDRIWDIWRLEGPAFVWHFRGTPHVHVWVHVANDPRVKLNA